MSSSSAAATSVVKESPKLESIPDTNFPTLAETQAAVARVYQRAVVVDNNHPNPFIVGDFNGDTSQDIAVVVKPNKELLSEINSEFANWISEDPRKVALFNPNKSVQQLPALERAKIEQEDTLLAIIHGYQQSGWRNPDAKQSYLLKNGNGEKMQALPLRGFPPALRIVKEGIRSRADVITENAKGVRGFLYWTNGKYAWLAY
jgi:hypothetical protein